MECISPGLKLTELQQGQARRNHSTRGSQFGRIFVASFTQNLRSVKRLHASSRIVRFSNSVRNTILSRLTRAAQRTECGVIPVLFGGRSRGGFESTASRKIACILRRMVRSRFRAGGLLIRKTGCIGAALRHQMDLGTVAGKPEIVGLPYQAHGSSCCSFVCF
jgi:hypothetical protein